MRRWLRRIRGAVGMGELAVSWALTGILTLMAAGSAAGSLALARRADDQELLEDGADVADTGLTEEEMHQLLGA